MQFLPFPEPIRSQFAEATRQRYGAEVEARRAKGMRGPYTPRVGSSQTLPEQLAYRTADGALRGVYDPYRAEYPAGATPGTATIIRTAKFYPNETHAYEDTLTDFRPLDAD